MEARYLTKDDVIVHKGKYYLVLATKIQGKKIIVQTNGGRLTFRLNQRVLLD